jgi:hypothetical protein
MANTIRMSDRADDKFGRTRGRRRVLRRSRIPNMGLVSLSFSPGGANGYWISEGNFFLKNEKTISATHFGSLT